MLIIFILINIKSLLVFHLKREDILIVCHSNPEIIVNHIESLNDHIESLESELNDAKEEIRNLKAILNQNSQNSINLRPLILLSRRKLRAMKKRVIDILEVRKDILALH